MKRVYFIGLDEIYDSELKKKIFEELEKIINSNEVIEFWLFKNHNHFTINCMFIALLLKYKYPQKDIKIVWVIEPVKYYPRRNEHLEEYDSIFPYCFADRLVYAENTVFNSPGEIYNYVSQTNYIERWVIKQCNCIIAYYYSIIDCRLDKILTYATKRSNTDVIRFSFDETEQLIRDELDTMDQLTKDIFNMIHTEKSLAGFAKKLGVTKYRISNTLKKTRQIIYQRINAKKINCTSQRDRVCCLTFLKENPTVHQLNLFDCFLKYLVREFEIREFWVDELSCNTPYLDVLLNFDKNFLTKPKIKAFKPIGEGNKYDWDKFFVKYKHKIPEFIGIPSTDRDIYKEITHKAKYLVTDFTVAKSSLIHELCLSDNDVNIFDVSYRFMEVDYQY